MSLAFTLDAAAFARAAGLLEAEPARVERALRTLTQRRARLTKEALQRATPLSHPRGDDPEHTPHMRDLWHQETTGPSESVVFNEAPYGGFLFSGTSPHEIRARSGGVLHFYAGGSEVFTPVVEHPGMRRSEPLVTALESQLDKAAGDLFDYGIHEMSRLAHEIG